MAIAYRGAVANSDDGTKDVALDLSTITGLATNDVVIVAYAIGDNDGTDFTMAIAVGTGWTKIADLHVDDDDDCDLGVFWKRMGASVDTSVTVDGQGGNDASVSALAVAFSGVDTTNALDVTTTTNTGASSADADPPEIDWSTAGTAVVICVAAAHDAAGTFTFPAGYTTNAQQRTHADTTDATVGIGYKLSPADPENPGAATHSNTATTASWCAATIALRTQQVALETKTDTDTGTLDDTALGAYTATATADAGTLADAGVLTLEGVDTGTLAEVGTLTPAVASSDTGTLSSGLTVAVAELAPYGGTLAEAGIVNEPKADTDTGTLAENGVVAATASNADTDAGTLAETGAITAAASVGTDTGTSAEDGVITAAASLGTDTGTAAENGVLTTIATAVSDTASLAETGTTTALATDTEAGTLADTGVATASGGTAPSDTDDATLTELGAVGAAVPVTDAASLADTGSVAAATITAPVAAPASSSYTTFLMPRTRDYRWREGSEKWLLREVAVLDVTPVAPADVPPDPFSWLADVGDEDFVAVGLLNP